MAAAATSRALLSTNTFSFSKFRHYGCHLSLNALPIIQQQGVWSRRLLLVSAISPWDALRSSWTAQKSAREASLAVKRGMQLFLQGNVEQSLAEFDRAIDLDPRQRAYLWQRGLALYYANRFEEGATQFRDDVAANPNDTEESIWCFLCEAQLYGIDEARRRFLEVGPDQRSIMQKAYMMFKNGGNPDELIAEFSNGTQHDYFYAALYASLYYEAQNNQPAAEAAMKVACHSPYGLRGQDTKIPLFGWPKSIQRYQSCETLQQQTCLNK